MINESDSIWKIFFFFLSIYYLNWVLKKTTVTNDCEFLLFSNTLLGTHNRAVIVCYCYQLINYTFIADN